MSPTPATTPRPVTPVGIVAALLETALDRLAAVDVGAADDAAALDDVRRDLGRAHAIATGLDPYLAANAAAESAGLARLRELTAGEDWSARRAQLGADGPHLEQEMLSGHVEGAFLAFLVRLTGARRVLEIGMFTGYSALAMAEALPGDGTVTACELDPYVAGLAMEAFAAAGEAGRRISVEVGPALATLEKLADVGESFDLVFVDADKPGYAAYLDAVLETGLLAPGGLVCVDNTLLQGEPWLDGTDDTGGGDDGAGSDNGRAIAAFNARVAADARVEQVLVPLRDGITLIRRR